MVAIPWELSSPRDRRTSGRLFVVGTATVWAAGVLRLFYERGSGEHDTFMMAAGVVRAAHTGEVLNAYCYSPYAQFLFYYLARALTYLHAPDTAGVLLAMNVVGALCALAVPLLLVPVLSAFALEAPRARLAAVLLLTSPMYFYMVSYGHPFHLALVVFLLSCWILAQAMARLPSAAGWVSLAGAVALQSLALMIRFEQVALFAALLVALLARRRGRWWRDGAIAAGTLVVSLALFAAVLAFVAAEGAGVPSNAEGARAGNVVQLLLRSADPSLLRWGAVHMGVEVGLPLVLLGLAAVAYALAARRRDLLLLVLAGAVPSAVVYLGNPSPPRHFYVLTAGLACLVAAAAPAAWVERPRRVAVGALAVNLAAPWAFILIDGKPYPVRADVAYNVVERTDRNAAQIDRGAPLYTGLIARARQGPVLLIGNWIHVAQVAALLADDPRVALERTAIVDGVSALAFRGGGVELYLVETYDPSFATAVLERVRKSGRPLSCVSLVEGGAPANDPGLEIPPEIHWWNA